MSGTLLAAVMLLGSGATLQAQWLTQTFDLIAGWNAVYLHVDASHAVLDDLMAVPAEQPIEEIWQWNSELPAAQFVLNPAIPVDTGTPWASWVRGQGPTAVLKKLTGNTAYLVRVANDTPTHRWNLIGTPVAPRYDWTITGLNFLGFPTLPTAPPSFLTFLQQSPPLLNAAEISRYPGGPLGANNPMNVSALDATPVRRGEAFWIRAGDLYNRYFGPFSVELPPGGALHFGDASNVRGFRVRNQAPRDVVVTLELVASENPPAGQPAIQPAPPPILLRGPVNTTNLTFGYTNLSAPKTWTLKPAGQPGSEVEVVLGVNRQQMSGQPGDRSAAILRLTDSLNLTRVDLPISATVASKAGLWVGAASVTQVRHYLKQYEKTGDGQLVLTSDGKYQVTSFRGDLGDVGRPYPLRLIVHTDATGENGRLLQRVYLGPKTDGTAAVATREELLDPAHLADARRISAVHLPWSASNSPWPCTGALRPANHLVATVNLAYGETASNPFLHMYHPDHDNRNETFDKRASRGEESYDLRRQVILRVLPPDDDFTSLTRGHNTLNGEYIETITLTGVTKPGRPQPENRTFEVRGSFSLNRLTDIPVLTTE